MAFCPMAFRLAPLTTSPAFSHSKPFEFTDISVNIHSIVCHSNRIHSIAELIFNYLNNSFAFFAAFSIAVSRSKALAAGLSQWDSISITRYTAALQTARGILIKKFWKVKTAVNWIAECSLVHNVHCILSAGIVIQWNVYSEWANSSH